MCAVTWAGAKVGLRLRLRLRLRARVGCARARADPRRGSGAPTHGRGSGLGRTQAVSASTTRATRLARSRQCALRSGAQQGQLDLTACDRHETRRVGRAVWGCRAGRSRVAEVLRQRRARAAQAAHVPRAAAPPMALWHGSVATDRRPARRPPSVKNASHRNGAAHRSTRTRGRAVGMFYRGGGNFIPARAWRVNTSPPQRARAARASEGV